MYSPSSNSSSAGGARDQLVASLLDAIDVADEKSRVQIQDEVSNDFSEFLRSYSKPEADQLLAVLTRSYAEINLVAGAIARGELSDEQIEILRDPQYVLSSMQRYLSAVELGKLEAAMEARSRDRFEFSMRPALETAVSSMSENTQTRLMDRLFSETYLRLNPDGMGTDAGMSTRADLQLQAIRATREHLMTDLSPQEFSQANEFLAQQEVAQAAFGIIFD